MYAYSSMHIHWACTWICRCISCKYDWLDLSSFVLAGADSEKTPYTLSPGNRGRPAHVYSLGADLSELELIVRRKVDYTLYTASNHCENPQIWQTLLVKLFELTETSTKSVAFWAWRNRLWPQRPCGFTTRAMKALLDSRIGQGHPLWRLFCKQLGNHNGTLRWYTV